MSEVNNVIDGQNNPEPVVNDPVPTPDPESKAAEPGPAVPAPDPQLPEDDPKGDDSGKAVDIEYKFPENFTEDFVTKAETLELLKKHSVTQEALDDLIPTFTKVAEKVQEQSVAAWKAQVKTWAEVSASDTEFGGEKYDENIKTVIGPVLDRWGSKGLMEILDQTGMAEHPEVMRFFYKIGKDVAKDGKMIFGDRDSKGGATRSLADMARQLYPSMSEDK